jgi:hypothetical protein
MKRAAEHRFPREPKTLSPAAVIFHRDKCQDLMAVKFVASLHILIARFIELSVTDKRKDAFSQYSQAA